MENNVKFCSNCGQQLAADATFCTNCGTAQAKADAAPANEAPAQAPVNEAPAAAPAAKKLPIPTKAITPLIVAVLALIMLITAFLPIFTIKSDDLVKDTKFNISAINAATFMLDSFKALEYEDIADSAIGEQIDEVQEELYDEMSDLDPDDYKSYNDIPSSIRNLYNKMLVLSYRAELQLEDTKTNVAIIVAGVSSIAYIVAAVALFALAALKLLAALKPEADENQKDVPQSKINRLFFAVPALLALAYFTLGLSLNISSKTYAPATGATVTFVVAALALAASIACEFLADKEKFLATLKANMNKVIGIGASLVLSIALIVSLSAPVLSATVKAKFGGRDSKKEASIGIETGFFADLALTEDEEAEYEEMAEAKDKTKESRLESSVEGFAGYTVKQVENGEAYNKNNNFLKSVSAYDGFYTMNIVFSLIPVLYIVAFVLALYTLLDNIMALVNGEKSKKSYTVICAAVVVIAIALAFFYTIKVNGALDTYKVKDYSLGLSLGAILAAVFAIGAKAVEVVLGKKAAPVAPAAPQDETPAA